MVELVHEPVRADSLALALQLGDVRVQERFVDPVDGALALERVALGLPAGQQLPVMLVAGLALPPVGVRDVLVVSACPVGLAGAVAYSPCCMCCSESIAFPSLNVTLYSLILKIAVKVVFSVITVSATITVFVPFSDQPTNV